MEEEKKAVNEQAEADAEPEVESAAAKRLKALGISTEPEEPAEPIKKASFIENFWYHHKWGFIAAVAGIAIAAVGVFQLISKVDPDVYLMYAGPVYFDSEETKELNGVMGEVIPGDFNGDGKKHTAIMQAMYLSDAKIEQYKEEAADAGYTYSYDAGFNAAELDRIRQEFMMSNSIILLLDPAVYNEIKGEDTLVPLDEIFAKTPSAAIDRFGIKFSELDFKKYNMVFDDLPSDTVLAVRRPTEVANYGSRDKEDVLSEHIRVVNEIVAFKAPEYE